MTTKLNGNERLIKHMIPEFAVGCRRPTPGNGYLEALLKPNVRVVTDNIQNIIPEGIVLTTGEVIKVDTFICATGFDISFCPRFNLVGQNGVSLSEQWKSVPSAYLSLATENFPNYFSKPIIICEYRLVKANAISVSRPKCTYRTWFSSANS
jgi:cation diffusion facilitator CzcD-associated flavoprotein CzcO